jgi:glycosyltransferase involved in cell wall biosynthesis
LGIIPHDHLFQLMRQSLAVLQPSIFEGWSTTVEEVKSLGKRIILSDLPVHREQNPPQARYFDPQNPEVLAAELLKAFAENTPGPDLGLEREARRMLPERIAQFGMEFIKIVEEVI